MQNKMNQGQLIRTLFFNRVAKWEIFVLIKQASSLRASEAHLYPCLLYTSDAADE